MPKSFLKKMLLKDTAIAFSLLFSGLVSSQTSQDFLNLRESLLRYIAENPVEIAPPLVRISFHDMFNFDPATQKGSPRGMSDSEIIDKIIGCLLENPVINATENKGITDDTIKLVDYVRQEFPNVPFTTGDIISFGGKVAMEVTYPCMKIKWSFGRPECKNASEESLIGPLGNISTLNQFQPVLTRFNFSAREMAVLTAGSHGIATAAAALENSGFGDFDFANINSGKDWIEKSTKSKWREVINENNQTQYLTDDYGDQSLGRLPSDMVFFPRTLQSINAQIFDLSLSGVQDYLESFLAKDRSEFDNEFALVYSKLLYVGTERDNLTLFEDSYNAESSCSENYSYPLLYLSGWNSKSISAFVG